MNKFEGVTIVHIGGADYTEERLNPTVYEEANKADVVINSRGIVKNRVSDKDNNNAKINQLENAQRLNAVINAFRFSWVQLSGKEIESILNIASEYTCSIESYLTGIAEGENNENVQR